RASWFASLNGSLALSARRGWCMENRVSPDANANAAALPLPPSNLLGGVVAGASLCHVVLPAFMDDTFALVPHHTIFSPIASLPFPFIWNLLTAHLFEASLLRALLVTPAVVCMAQRLERLWSWRRGLLYLAFSCVATSLVFLVWEVVEVFRTSREKDFFSGTRGCCGLVVALSVGLRHAYPLEALPFVPKAWGLQCQHLPFCLALLCTLLGLGSLLPEWPYAPLAFFFAWFYLRYLMWFSHARAYGDHSPDFLFANLFPPALRPIAGAVGALTHNLAAAAAPGLLRLRSPEDDAERAEAIVYDPSRMVDGAVLWNSAGAMSLAHASSSSPWPSPLFPAQSGEVLPGAPGSKEYDARRAKALKLLDESISSMLVPKGARPDPAPESADPSTAPDARAVANGDSEANG
ncbi:unnamed protein product, partial [Effrenium voratum]